MTNFRPVMPKTIMSGLMTCRPAEPLPKDLNDFVEVKNSIEHLFVLTTILQGAEHGVIFVSFGSVIKVLPCLY